MDIHFSFFTRMPIKLNSWEPIPTDEIRTLTNTDYYPAKVLARALGFRDNRPIIKFYDEGIIDDDSCRNLNPDYIKGRRGRGVKAKLQILGREIKRIVREGPRPKDFSL